MRYIIEKNVNGFKYWWNDQKCQWQGLKDNASFIYPEELDLVMRKISMQGDQNHISHHPVN